MRVEKGKEDRATGQAPPRGGAPRPVTEKPAAAPKTAVPSNFQTAYPYEFRRRAVQLHLEEGIPCALVAQELGVACVTVHQWTKRYR